MCTKVQKTREMSKPAKVDERFESHESLQWPRFNLVPTAATFKMPCADTCQRIFHEACNEIEDCLLRKLFSRKPGKILRWDGTFAIMAKMMDHPEAEVTNDVLAKILGEHGLSLRQKTMRSSSAFSAF
jgi:hypothetical protein